MGAGGTLEMAIGRYWDMRKGGPGGRAGLLVMIRKPDRSAHWSEPIGSDDPAWNLIRQPEPGFAGFFSLLLRQ